MSYIPINTTPGLVAALIGQTIPVGRPQVSGTITHLLMRRTDESGSIEASGTFEIEGGASVAWTIPAGQNQGDNTVSLPVSANDNLQLTVLLGDGMNLSGWAYIPDVGGGVQPSGPFLTSSDRIKDFDNIQVSTWDDLLTNFAGAVTIAFEAYCGRGFLEQAITDEYHVSWTESIVLREFGPISNLALTSEDGDALDINDYRLDGRIVARKDHGRILYVTYVNSAVYAPHLLEVTLK